MTGLKFTELEIRMITGAMEFIEAGEWPWSKDMDGTSARDEAAQRAAWDRAKVKLNNYNPRKRDGGEGCVQERERIAKFVEAMDEGPLTTKAVKSWIAAEIRNSKSD